jgi:CelD/BcsL family acetyltransferase involved in cellulose biosynthesis
MEKGEEEALKEFYNYLHVRRDMWHVIQFQRVPSDLLDNVAVIQNARENNFIAETVDSYHSPYIQIECGWDEYMSTLKSKFRSNLRNRTKRLNRLGKVDYELINGSKDIEKVLRRGYEIEGKSWKRESGSAILCDANLESFYLEVAKVAMQQNWLRLSFLKVGGQYVSFDYSLAYNDKIYCLKIGYDQEFHEYSVGPLLCSEILRSCFENNIKEYDFMGEKTRQKTDWTSASRHHLMIFIYNKSLISRMDYLYRFHLKKRVKSLLKKWSVT